MIRLVLIGAALALRAAAASAAPASQLDDFELRDQHGISRAYDFPRSKVSVMTVADHRGSAQLAAWIEPVHARYGKRIDIDGVADVSMIARPFHGIFRKAFRDRLTYSVMLDWEGAVVRQFQYRRNVANVFVVDVNGRIVARFTGPATPAGHRELFRQIDRALRASRRPDG